jgi:hypothetical protein
MVLTKEEIRERLQTDSVTIGTSRTALTEAVPESKMRYIVAIILIGDGTASRTVDIEKLEEDGTTYTMKFNDVPVAPADVRQLPTNYDIENPILVLEGGTTPYGTVSAGSGLNATIVYWDSEIG